MSYTTIRTESRMSNIARKIHVFEDETQPIFFEDDYIHYIHADALRGIDRLTIESLSNAKVHFLGQLCGSSGAEGVLHVADCKNVLFTNLDVINKAKFVARGHHVRLTCAVRVSDSCNVGFVRSKFTGSGRKVFLVTDNSDVALSNVIVSGASEVIYNYSSRVNIADLSVFQDSPEKVSMYPLINLHGRSHEGPTFINVDGAHLDIRTVHALIGGQSGAYGDMDTRASFKNVTFGRYRPSPFGVCSWDEECYGLNISTDFFADHPDGFINPDKNGYLSRKDLGFARYIDLRDPRDQWTLESGRPIQRPTIVDHLKSSDVVKPKPIVENEKCSDSERQK